MTAIDVGANVGFYTRLFSRLVGPTGRVYSYEPSEENFARLSSNVARLGNVQVHNLAVTQKSGYATLFISDKLNVDHRTYDTGENRRRATVRSVSLDEHLRDRLDEVNFVKIDIQGAELAALRGMVGLLRKSKNVCLLVEFWPVGLRAAGVEPEELLEFLREEGFNINVIGGSQLEPFKMENKAFDAMKAYLNLLCFKKD